MRGRKLVKEINMIRIAIDGPGGAGKSSLAKAVAKRLGIIYVDTGALYRTIGVYMLGKGINPSDEEKVSANLPDLKLELKFIDGNQVILLNGKAVGDEIRTPEASMAASAVSALGSVREFLLMTQRNIAENNSVIMDGRDIGTVILPYAEVKIFLTASPEARAKRRFAELTAKGIETTYEKVYTEMVERDKNDSTRALAPCVPADDAVLLDNSELTAEGTTDAVLKIVNKEIKQRKKKFNPFYRVCRILITVFMRLTMIIKVTGKENIPAEGGVVLCSNHIGIRDVFLIGITYPRQLFFLSKKEWFKIPVMSSVMRAWGAIPLDRGGKDVGALKNAVVVAKKGKTLALFPQGTRKPGINPKDTQVKSGAGMIAYHSHADMLPVCIKTDGVKYRFMRKIEVIYGKPIKYSELGFERGSVGEFKDATSKVFDEICELGGYSSLPSDEGEQS